jgi:hypothetical protein
VCPALQQSRAHRKPPLDQFKLLVSSISKHISIGAAAVARGKNARRASDTIRTTPFSARLFLSRETKTRSQTDEFSVRGSKESHLSIIPLFLAAAEHTHPYLGRIAARYK